MAQYKLRFLLMHSTRHSTKLEIVQSYRESFAFLTQSKQVFCIGDAYLFLKFWCFSFLLCMYVGCCGYIVICLLLHYVKINEF